MNRREYCKHGQLNNEIAWCTQCTDAEIAALTERLRAVEAERDECATGEQCMADEANAKDRENVSLRAQLSALRAELQRKDAALRKAREERVDAAKRLSKQAARWLDDFIADSELIDAINGELDAALENLRSDNDGK